MSPSALNDETGYFIFGERSQQECLPACPSRAGHDVSEQWRTCDLEVTVGDHQQPAMRSRHPGEVLQAEK